MSNKFKLFIFTIIAVSLIALPCSAKRTLFRGDQVGKGSLEIEHNLDVGGTSTFAGAATFSGATTLPTGTGGFEIPLDAFHINGTGPMGADGTTAPGIATTDSIPKIVYASSAETASIGYSFMVPPDYSTGLYFRMAISSSAATPASMSIDWQLVANSEDTGFGTLIEQTAVSPASTKNVNASNAYLTFTPDATGASAIASADSVTVWFWNGDTRLNTNTTEISNVQALYTKTR